MSICLLEGACRDQLQPVASKANDGSATTTLGCLLRSLVDEASGGSIPKMTGCVLLLSDGKVNGNMR